MKREIRTYGIKDLELRSVGDKNTLVGHAAMFNSFSRDLGGFREVITPGAFKRAITENQDVRALWNHDANHVLGRTTAGTLRLSEDDKGLAIEIDLPNTSAANDLRESIGRGDVDQMSFAFITRSDEWTDQVLDGKRTIVRELRDVDLFDVSPVTYPAYEATDIALRGLEQIKKHGLDVTTKRNQNLIRRINLAKITADQ